MKINLESIAMTLFIVFIFVVYGLYFFAMPVCNRLTRDLSAQQLQECLKK